jgi:hypothetical protein
VGERIEFPLASGGTVQVEVPATAWPPGGTTGASRGGGARGAGGAIGARMTETLRDTLAPVIGAASDMMAAFTSMARRPDEIEVQFGVSLETGTSAIVAHGTVGGHLDVTLRWKPPAGSATPPGGAEPDAVEPVPSAEDTGS